VIAIKEEGRGVTFVTSRCLQGVESLLESKLLLDHDNCDTTGVRFPIDDQKLIDGAGLAIHPLCALAF
jgi:hypothetical protein